MSQFKRKLSAFTAMLAFLSLASIPTFAAGPGDVSAMTGNMDVTKTGSITNVDNISGANGSVGQVDWMKFNVAKGEQVNFGFSGLSQTIIKAPLAVCPLPKIATLVSYGILPQYLKACIIAASPATSLLR